MHLDSFILGLEYFITILNLVCDQYNKCLVWRENGNLGKWYWDRNWASNYWSSPYSATCQRESSYHSSTRDEIEYVVVNTAWECSQFCMPYKTTAPTDGFCTHWYYDGGCYCLSLDQVNGDDDNSDRKTTETDTLAALIDCVPCKQSTLIKH